MGKKLSNPHDKYFRSALSNKDIAIDFIKGFMPKEVVEALDFAYFEQVTDSFIDKEFKASISDIIYKTRFTDSEQEVFISLLFEHKSYYEGDTIFQLHRYLPNIWEQHVKQGKDRPLVIPLVIYHGQQKWKKKGIEDFFKLPNEYFSRFLPIFEYILVDISKYSEEEILSMHLNAMVVNMVMALKYGRDSSYLLENIDKVMYRSMEYVDIQLGMNFLEITFVYLASINQFPDKKWDVMIQKLPKPVKTTAMTMYERLISKGQIIGKETGLKIGKEIGKETGLKIGKEIGKAEEFKLMLKVLKLHKQKVAPKKIAVRLEIPLEKVHQLIAAL